MGKTPVKTRKSKVGSLQSTLEHRADAAFTRCPSGHPLPHRTEKGRCTPLLCAEKAGTGLSRLRDDKVIDPEERLAKVKGDEEMRIKVQTSRAQVWQDFLQIPVDLKGADAEKYFDDEIVNMLPFAVGVLKKQLHFGTEEQQERAATKVMDANGRGKREAGGTTAPSIIINMVQADGSTGMKLPWRKDSPAEATVEVKSLPDVSK